MAGLNSISINSRAVDYVGLVKGLNSVSPNLEYNQLILITGEDGSLITDLVTITVESAQGSYVLTTNTGKSSLFVYTSAGLPIEHTVTLTDGTLTQVYTFTPVYNEVRELPLTRVKFDPLSIFDAIGNIDQVFSVTNAILTDTTGWDADSPKAIPFPVASTISSEPLFYFGRLKEHILLSVDISYEAITGRTVNESLDIRF